MANDSCQVKKSKTPRRRRSHNPGHLDTHPLVREYFGEQLRSQRIDAWKECNRRLYHYYRTLAPQLPDSFREMEPLFLAVICGCNAGLFREALHEVYIPRIQRGNASFAAKVLGARAALLSVLAHFFEHGRWGSPGKRASRGRISLRKTALHPPAGGAISYSHARIGSTRGANLLRARGVLVSFAESSSRLVFRIGRSVALFPRHRQAHCDDADCQTSLLTGAGAE